LSEIPERHRGSISGAVVALGRYVRHQSHDALQRSLRCNAARHRQALPAGCCATLLRSQITPAASTVEQIAQRVIHVDAAIKHSALIDQARDTFTQISLMTAAPLDCGHTHSRGVCRLVELSLP
jgi:acetate kinase